MQTLDGIFYLNNESFLIETKFSHEDFGAIARLHLLVESRPIGTMGLLFASDGFTSPANEAAHLLRPIRVLLFFRSDIEYALSQQNMIHAVQLKKKLAVKFGRCSMDLIAASDVMEQS